MAMNPATLGADLAPVIESKIRQYVIDGDSAPYAQLTAFSQALAEAIAEKVVAHIVDNAEVDTKIDGTFEGVVTDSTCETTFDNVSLPGTIT